MASKIFILAVQLSFIFVAAFKHAKPHFLPKCYFKSSRVGTTNCPLTNDRKAKINEMRTFMSSSVGSSPSSFTSRQQNFRLCANGPINIIGDLMRKCTTRLKYFIRSGHRILASLCVLVLVVMGNISPVKPAFGNTNSQGVEIVRVVNTEETHNAAHTRHGEVIGKGTGTATKVLAKSEGDSKTKIQSTDALGEIQSSWDGLLSSLEGSKLDSLIILMVTSAVIPICKRLGSSPIVGFLLTGTLMGPAGLNLVKDVHMIDVLGELGIVFFLFEMGLELSLEKLKAMKKDVFGLGTSQFLLTAGVATGIAVGCGIPIAAAVTIGGSLSLSSSAFALQLLKDKKAMGTRHGKASFGILLLQDLAVVPLLVIVEILSKGGTGLGRALSVAAMKAVITLTTLIFFGRRLLDPIFYYVARSKSQEAFLSIILSTVFLMSFVTQGIGLSNTLGAFLAGLLLAETRYHFQIEADIAPFRGLLLGIFFMTVGFNLDIKILIQEAPKVLALLTSLIVGKAAIIATLCRGFGLSWANAQQTGLLLSQGGEFAFVALGIAERGGLVSVPLQKLLLTTVALSMALTPLLDEFGVAMAKKIEQNAGFMRVMDPGAEDVKSSTGTDDFVLVAGYGRVGRMICDMLDRQLMRYVALDNSPQRAIEARAKGLPVFFGDVNRAEIMKNFDLGSAKACVITISDKAGINKAVVSIRKHYPNLPIIVRANNAQHEKILVNMFEGVYAMTPVLPEDSVLLTLPFGGAVLQRLGVSEPEVNAIMESLRKMYIEEQSVDATAMNFFNAFERLPSPTTTVNADQAFIPFDKEDHTYKNGGEIDAEELAAVLDELALQSDSNESSSDGDEWLVEIDDKVNAIKDEVSLDIVPGRKQV